MREGQAGSRHPRDDGAVFEVSVADARRIVVTGASRGIGLEYVRQWAQRGDRVFALARDPSRSTELMDLAGRFPDTLVPVPCDVADEPSVEAARRKVAGTVDGLELLVNNAGVMGAWKTFEKLDLEEIRHHVEVNALGPLRMTRAFLPLLRAGRGVPRLVHMTSLMGSIEDNRSGNAYAYRMSKAALNMASRSLAVDLADDGIVSVVLHPGWVKTDMGGSSARLTVEEAVTSLIETIDGLGSKQSGGFYDREGQPLPW